MCHNNISNFFTPQISFVYIQLKMIFYQFLFDFSITIFLGQNQTKEILKVLKALNIWHIYRIIHRLHTQEIRWFWLFTLSEQVRRLLWDRRRLHEVWLWTKWYSISNQRERCLLKVFSFCKLTKNIVENRMSSSFEIIKKMGFQMLANVKKKNPLRSSRNIK